MLHYTLYEMIFTLPAVIIVLISHPVELEVEIFCSQRVTFPVLEFLGLEILYYQFILFPMSVGIGTVI